MAKKGVKARITSKQKSARRKNMAVARAAKKKNSVAALRKKGIEKHRRWPKGSKAAANQKRYSKKYAKEYKATAKSGMPKAWRRSVAHKNAMKIFGKHGPK